MRFPLIFNLPKATPAWIPNWIFHVCLNTIYTPFYLPIYLSLGFSGRSAGKESACNAGDPVLIPGSGRSPGEGIGYPLQYSWASLVAQMVKNPPAMGETQVQFLGQEDPRRTDRLPTPVFLGFPCGSAGKESACNAGDPSLIPGSGKIPWRRDRLPTPVFLGFPGGLDSKESACNGYYLGSIPVLGRSPGREHGNPLQ